MDEVILNDLPSTPHVHYMQREDWLFILVGIAVFALVVLAIHFISLYFGPKIEAYYKGKRSSKKGESRIKVLLNVYWERFVSSRFSRVLSSLLIVFVFAFLGIGLIVDLFDDYYGVDNAYRKIVAKKHQVSKEDLYAALNFTEPDYQIDSIRLRQFLFNTDSIPNDELRGRIDSLYCLTQDTNSYNDLFFLASMNGFPTDIQNYFFCQSLKHSRTKYETLNTLLQLYVVNDDVEGMLAIDSLAMQWKWELGFYDKRYKPQDELRTKSLYYVINNLERDVPITDSLARRIYEYAKEGCETVFRDVGYSTLLNSYFEDVRAKYAYKLGDPKADDYADKLISHSTFYHTLFDRTGFLGITWKGWDVDGYYRRFFEDPLFIRYKSLLKEKKYKKASLALRLISSRTHDADFNPDKPYEYLHDSLIVHEDYNRREILTYAKYDLASISENARLKYLMRKRDSARWMTGTYITGASYLSPSEGMFATLDRYAFDGDVCFADLIPFIVINYNNPDARWIYNTALFVKGTSSIIPSLIKAKIQSTNNQELIELFDELNSENVFQSTRDEGDSRYLRFKVLMMKYFRNDIKSILSDCFLSYLDVKESLSENECAIEFVKVPSINFKNDIYKAVILKRDWDVPKVVDLASSQDINNCIISGQYYSDPEARLYRLIWRPLERYIKNSKVVYYSPDGIIGLVNLSAIPDNHGSMLSERYEIRQCVSTKDIKPIHQDSVKEIVLFGGMTYDEDSSIDNSYRKDKGPNQPYRGFDCNIKREGFSYLPGTLSEIGLIHSEAIKHGINSTLFSGGNGNELSFKSLTGSSVDILHIATHGFYYNSSLAEDYTFFEKMPHKDNPLNRCGLMMTGGQKAWLGEEIPSEIEDGILLGSEIARMDLSSVDLVVLSACNTGLGDITNEGVSGLQKAFKQAGVKSIVMTLSKVDDNATIKLMSIFYDNLFAGLNKREAFNKAIEAMKKDPEYSDPYYWAPFVFLN